MEWDWEWSRRLSVMEELRGKRCSPARADSRSSSVAPEEEGESTYHLVNRSQPINNGHFTLALQAHS